MSSKDGDAELDKERQATRNTIAGLRDNMAAEVQSKEAALQAVKDQRKAAFNPYEN